MTYTYTPKGVCSRKMTVELDRGRRYQGRARRRRLQRQSPGHQPSHRRHDRAGRHRAHARHPLRHEADILSRPAVLRA